MKIKKRRSVLRDFVLRHLPIVKIEQFRCCCGEVDINRKILM
ncbi:hypothetical protein NSE_0702 [Neorickettsia sennetsu str. Miyayama]|uniref:Uncharacterized protein n=1 Tax=Ehrlichia sennetsu (strain ATCC VR-367 / Miyayama) TaxID=222891 RepID=Q2GD68_EHRS3|nr:hypothetical protein NSE_0702 [Neorickettsia sennetsu str. Miyayama]